MFICEIWLFDWYFPQFCTSDMSKYGFLEVFQRVTSTSRRESTVLQYTIILAVSKIFCGLMKMAYWLILIFGIYDILWLQQVKKILCVSVTIFLTFQFIYILWHQLE